MADKREPRANLRHLCGDCGAQQPTRLDGPAGKFLKVGFPTRSGAGPSSEWMWVRVPTFEDRVGVLNNDPAYLGYVKNGDTVRFAEREGRFHFVERVEVAL